MSDIERRHLSVEFRHLPEAEPYAWEASVPLVGAAATATTKDRAFGLLLHQLGVMATGGIIEIIPDDAAPADAHPAAEE